MLAGTQSRVTKQDYSLFFGTFYWFCCICPPFLDNALSEMNHVYMLMSHNLVWTLETHMTKPESSYKSHILPTSLLFRPCILKTMLERSCSSALSPFGKSGSKGNIFLFSSPLYVWFPVLYVIHHQYQDKPLVLYRSPTFPPKKLRVSGSNIWLWAAQEPPKENHTLYFSISLRMKIEGRGGGAIRGALWPACWRAPSLAKHEWPAQNICPSSKPGSARAGFRDSLRQAKETLLFVWAISFFTKNPPTHEGLQALREHRAGDGTLWVTTWERPKALWDANFYPRLPVSIQWRVLQRVSSPEVLVSPLCLLGLSSSAIESTASLCMMWMPRECGPESAFGSLSLSWCGWRRRHKRGQNGKAGDNLEPIKITRQFTKLDKMRRADTHKLNNVIEVGLLVVGFFFPPVENWRNRKDQSSSYCALAVPSWWLAF